MKKVAKKGVLTILLAGVLLVTGCSGQKQSAQTDTSKKEATTQRVFTDSTGRKVKLPNKITRIAPSGPLAQLVLYSSAPDKLVGLSSEFPSSAKDMIPEKYQKLPKFGQFYGKSSNLNMEALSAADPQVIVDIGEKKDSEKEDMNKLQKQLDIPTVFIEANLDDLPTTYKKLGQLTGLKKNNQELADYCQKVLTQAKKARQQIGNQKTSIYYASGKTGLSTNAEGSFQATIFDTVGLKNVVRDVEISSQGSGTTVSLEQLMQWQPDYIIADSAAVYKTIMTDASWQQLTAVQKKQVYQVPSVPYNFLGFPPSVNRIMGIQWLGHLIYPDQYDLNIRQNIKQYYRLFWHISLTDKQLDQLLVNATK